jgi:hypothetical protein
LRLQLPEDREEQDRFESEMMYSEEDWRQLSFVEEFQRQY